MLRARGMLAGHLTAGPAHGGEAEAMTTAGALQHGFAERYWHAAVCAPGPGGQESGSALGHGGMVALDTAHAAAALGCRVDLPAPGGGRRVAPDADAARAGAGADAGRPRRRAPARGRGRHEWRRGEADLDAFAVGGLAAGLEDDPPFFAAALAAGSVLAQCAA